MTTTTIQTIQEKNSHQRSKRITTVIHLVLLALMLLPFMNYTPPPEPQQTAVVVDFRDFKSAAKKSSAKKSKEANGPQKEVVTKPVVKEIPKPKPKPVPVAKKKPVLTDEKAKVPVRTKPQVAEKPVEAPPEIVEEVPETPAKEPVKETKPVKETAPEKVAEPAKTTTASGAGSETTGSTSGEGEGKQGSSTSGDAKTDGVADEGDQGMDFSGDGIFGRRVIRRADVKKITTETGKIVINLCVDPNGRVVYTELNKELSTIKSKKILRKAEKLTSEYRFERDYTAPAKQCGKLTFVFDIEVEE